MENVQGPKKGLINAIAGKKPEAAQATEPAGLPGEAAEQTPEEFLSALVDAQDQQQTAAATKAAGLTKGEIKQAKIAAAEAAAKAQKGQKTESSKKAEKPSANLVKGESKAGQQATDAQAQAEAAQLLAQAQAAAQKPAQPQTLQEALVQAKLERAQQTLGKGAGIQDAGAQGAVGPKQGAAQAAAVQAAAAQAVAAQAATAQATAGQAHVAQGTAAALAEVQAALTAAQAAAVTAQQAAVMAQQTVLNAQLQGREGNVVQPIVIEMPMAIPVDVVAVDGDDLRFDDQSSGDAQPQGQGAGQALFGSKVLSSQDFMANRTGSKGILGVDRPDPRMSGRSGEEGFLMQAQGEQHSAQALRIPALGGHLAQTAVIGQASPNTVVSKTEVQVARNESGNAEIVNPQLLATTVRTLANEGGGSVKVRVSPENLGEMTIHVQNEGQKLNVAFEASTHQGREALANAMPELRQMLVASRYDVGRMEVNTAAGAGRAFSLAGVAASGGSAGSDSAGMGAWLNSQPQFGDWTNRGDSQQNQGGSAWDRYFAQRDARDQQEAGQGRQWRGYQRYQENEGLTA